MNKYFWIVIVLVFGSLLVAVPIGLKYSQAIVLFGVIALISAPIVLHKITDPNWSIGMLVGLSIYSSSPMKKLFQIEGMIEGGLITLAYGAVLWVIGFGWKQSKH